MKRCFFLFSLTMIAAAPAMAQNCNVVFTDDFSTPSDWTLITDGQSALNGSQYVLDHTVQDGMTENRVYQVIGTTLSDNYFRYTFEATIQPNSGNNGVGLICGALTAGTQDILGSTITGNYVETNQDAIFVLLNSDPADGDENNWEFLLEWKNGNVRSFDLVNTIAFDPATQDYYFAVERTDPGTIVLSVFLDAAQTVHASGSPATIAIDPLITGLTHVQHGVSTPGINTRENTATIDNDNICHESLAAVSEAGQSEELSWLLFPNPSSGSVQVQASFRADGYQVYDESGRLVLSGELSDDKTLTTEQLGDGFYYVVLLGATTPVGQKPLVIRK
jgi:hypothetical protein